MLEARAFRADEPAGRAIPNLALGSAAEHNLIGEALTARTAWPAVEGGYRFDDVSYFSQVIFDDQAFYDRLGGGFFQGNQSVRSSVLLRFR